MDRIVSLSLDLCRSRASSLGYTTYIPSQKKTERVNSYQSVMHISPARDLSSFISSGRMFFLEQQRHKNYLNILALRKSEKKKTCWVEFSCNLTRLSKAGSIKGGKMELNNMSSKNFLSIFFQVEVFCSGLDTSHATKRRTTPVFVADGF